MLDAVSSVDCASAIERDGALSSSVIVKVADAELLLVLAALEIATVTVSLFSSVLSFVIATVNVFVVCPAAVTHLPE